MFSMGTLYILVLLAVLLTELYAVQSKPSQQQPQRSQTFGGQGSAQAQKSEGGREQIQSVSVNCLPDSLEVVIQADLFGVGASVRSSDVRLGVDNDDRCKAKPSSMEEFKISAGLLDCGNKHWMNRDSLVYTNLLIYSPEPPAGGVVRMEEAVIPIECHYERKYSLSTLGLSPTWIPFVSTLSGMEKLNFNLKIMTSDWLYKRSSNMFFLGEGINIEASVRKGHHIGLRVFLSTCVATLTPDEHSLPRYVFIEDGCLLDSQLPNSRSKFLSRVQDDKLRLVLDAFRFHDEDRAEFYITCQATAVPVHDAEAHYKACTFINGRWRSADGNDYLCGYCQTQNEERHIKEKAGRQFSPRGFGGPEISERSWRSGPKTDKELDMKAKIGPLVLATETKTEPKWDSSMYGSLWRSGLYSKTGLTDNEVDEPEGLIENEETETTADKGLVPEDLSSPEEGTESVTESVDDFSLNGTDDSNDYTHEDQTPEETTDNLDLVGEMLVPEVLEFQGNETTPEPRDIHTTPLLNINITTSMNNTTSDVSVTKEPKRK